jgi:hypothetical protein
MSVTNVFGAYILPQSGGNPIYFDLVKTESVTRDADVTEFPVETGANITDHYRLKLNTIRLECFVSQEPIYPAIHPEGGGFYGSQMLAWPSYPTPDTLTVIAGAVTNPVGALLNALSPDPTSATVQGMLQWQNAFDSLSTLLTTLEGLRNTAQLVDVATRSYYYAGYLLGQIETSRDASTGSGTNISIELHQINQVATQSTTAPPIPRKPKDTPKVDKGVQQTQAPQQVQSALSAATAKAKSILSAGGGL